jgi:two-component system chemotaxis response regulator CheY
MAYDLSKIDILYLEQHQSMRAMVRMVLSTLGVKRIRDTGDVKVAEEMFYTSPPDIVIADWSPTVNGLAFLDKVRKDENSPARFTPFIIVTANTAKEDVIVARDHGMTEFLSKPFSARLLYERICSIIEKPREFIVTDSYVGPDRRRRREEFDGGDRRTAEPQEATDDASEKTKASGGEKKAKAKSKSKTDA